MSENYVPPYFLQMVFATGFLRSPQTSLLWQTSLSSQSSLSPQTSSLSPQSSLAVAKWRHCVQGDVCSDVLYLNHMFVICFRFESYTHNHTHHTQPHTRTHTHSHAPASINYYMVSKGVGYVLWSKLWLCFFNTISFSQPYLNRQWLNKTEISVNGMPHGIETNLG